MHLASGLLRPVIVVLLLANLAVLVWIVRKAQTIAAEWRRQHEQREPLASAYGMVEILIVQHEQLDFEKRMRIYALLRKKLGEALESMDAGVALRRLGEVRTDSASPRAVDEPGQGDEPRTAPRLPASPADAHGRR